MSNRLSEAIQYADDYKSDLYGMGEARKQAVTALLENHNDCETLLDVSTGRGETLKIARSIGYKQVSGTECIHELCNDDVVFAYSTELPFDDGEYDLVTCFDVLEHLVESDLVPTIRELARVASDRVIISASEMPYFFNGREQHISKRPAYQWEDLIVRALPRNKFNRTINAGDSPCWVIYA